MSSSYRQMFKSTSLIGGASLISGLIRMVQNKVVAVLLGAEGIALLEIFNSIVSLVISIVNLGLGNSGVRQIAEAAGREGSGREIAGIVKAYRRIIWFTGGLGGIVTVLFAPLLSQWFFKSTDYSWGIAFLGIAVLLTVISSGQQCVIQGLRRIADLSKIRILAALGAAICAIPCFFLWGKGGIVPAVVIAAAVTLLASWSFSRKVTLESVRLTWVEQRAILSPMIRLGICFMCTSVIMAAAIFLHKLLLTRMLGVESCGIYQAAFALSGLLIGFVLNAMGTDYYPRLVGLKEKPEEMTQAVNEQMEISLLLAIPALLGMMAFAPVLLTVFYAASFAPATELIRLFLFGILGQVVVWPLGYAVIAYGDGKLFVLCELIPRCTHLLLMYLGILHFGLAGAALSLGINYIFSGGMLFLLLRYRYRVRIASGVMLMTLGGIVLLGLTLFVSMTNGFWVQLGINCAVGVVVGVGCLSIMTRRLNVSIWARIKKKLGK